MSQKKEHTDEIKIETDYNWGSWNLLAWQKGRHFMMPPLVFPEKKTSKWEKSVEMTYWCLVTTLILVVLLIGWRKFFFISYHRSICFLLSSIIALFHVSLVPLVPLFPLFPLLLLVRLVPPCSPCSPSFFLFIYSLRLWMFDNHKSH